MIFYPYYIVIILFLLFVLFFNRKEVLFANTLPSSDKNYIYWSQIIIFIGVLLRVIALSSYPAGIFPDEAIGGYDSWCLANYGVDQHLTSNPVYLRSWGSGQSALYAYLGMPFVKLFGLSEFVYRIPMAIISSFSIIFFYYVFRKHSNNYLFVFILVLLLFFNPWHIMKSRWALDCNLAPDFILLSISFVALGFNTIKRNKQTIYYLLGSIFLVLTAYSYGVTWFMLPLFAVLLGVYLYKRNKISLVQIAISTVVMGLLLLPLILFAINLLTKGGEYDFLNITITQLKVSRHEETTIIGRFNLYYINYTIRKAAILMIYGDDKLEWNSFRYIGQFYNLLTLPFIAVALCNYIKKRKLNVFDSIFIICLIASIPVLIVIDANVNHWNVIWFPLIYLIARGILICIERFKRTKYLLMACYLVLTGFFISKYNSRFSENNIESNGFYRGVNDLVSFSKTLNLDKIYYTDEIVHVIPLFYKPISPYEFAETKMVKYLDSPIEHMRSYGNYEFSLPDSIEALPKTGYIIDNKRKSRYNIDYSRFHVRENNHFTLLWAD